MSEEQRKDEKAVRVHVHGAVQGVFYRLSTRTTARQLGLSGWVRNRRDGSVEAFFQGPAEAVEAAVAWCHVGPPGAVVERVEVAAADLDAAWFDFSVLK